MRALFLMTVATGHDRAIRTLNPVVDGDVEMGHARALLSLTGNEQSRAAQHVVENSLSVRETEALVRRLLVGTPAIIHKVAVALDPDVQRLQQDLCDKLGARVRLQTGARGKGKIIISYHSLDELEGILAHVR